MGVSYGCAKRSCAIRGTGNALSSRALEVAEEVDPDTYGPWRLCCRCLGPIVIPTMTA